MEWTLKPGDQIVRKDLHGLYGGRRQGGIGPSSQTPNVFLFSDPNVGERHGYVDSWKDDDCFHFTGEGQRGDQELVQGNAAIFRHRLEKRALRLFKGCGGQVEYQGQVAIAPTKPVYSADAPETGNGPIRKVLVFRLQSVDVPTSLQAPIIALPEANVVTIVPIEQSQTETFWVNPERVPYEAEKTEWRLVKDLASFLIAEGASPQRLKIQPVGEVGPTFCDLYCPGFQLLVEAKGSVTREAIRMAIGQIADYRRFSEVKTAALLLPSRPREDLRSLLSSVNIGFFYRDKGAFAYEGPAWKSSALAVAS